MNFIENPHKAWSFGNLKQKRVVQKMVFPEPIAIYPRELNGTVNLSLPFKLLKGFEGKKSELVDLLCENWNHLYNDIIDWSEALNTVNLLHCTSDHRRSPQISLGS